MRIHIRCVCVCMCVRVRARVYVYVCVSYTSYKLEALLIPYSKSGFVKKLESISVPITVGLYQLFIVLVPYITDNSDHPNPDQYPRITLNYMAQF